MSLTIWRLVKAKYASDVLSGRGSLLRAGRWNRKGLPIVYAAESPALALLETLVHVEEPKDLLAFNYMVVSLQLDEAHLTRLNERDLPSNWNTWPWPASTQRLGTQWFENRGSVVLELPSAVVPRQHNYLVNPQHPQFDELDVGDPEPFPIDPRLLNS